MYRERDMYIYIYTHIYTYYDSIPCAQHGAFDSVRASCTSLHVRDRTCGRRSGTFAVVMINNNDNDNNNNDKQTIVLSC